MIWPNKNYIQWNKYSYILNYHYCGFDEQRKKVNVFCKIPVVTVQVKIITIGLAWLEVMNMSCDLTGSKSSWMFWRRAICVLRQQYILDSCAPTHAAGFIDPLVLWVPQSMCTRQTIWKHWDARTAFKGQQDFRSPMPLCKRPLSERPRSLCERGLFLRC